MTTVSSQHITTAEQLTQAGDMGPCELVRGELIMMTPSHFPHARIGAEILANILIFVKLHQLGMVTGADGGYLFERSPDTVPAPDVGFVAAARIPPEGIEGYFPGAPDLAVEVNSPSDRVSEVLAKVHSWLAVGCRMVWVVDPPTRTVTVYRPQNRVALFGASDSLSGEDVLPGFQLPLVEVFSWQREPGRTVFRSLPPSRVAFPHE